MLSPCSSFVSRSLLILFLCQKCSLCESFPSCWAIMGSMGVLVGFFFFNTITPTTKAPVRELFMSLTLSFACLIVFRVSVSWSLDRTSLWNWVFLSLSRVWVGHCRLLAGYWGGVRRGWMVARWLVGHRMCLLAKIPDLLSLPSFSRLIPPDFPVPPLCAQEFQ